MFSISRIIESMARLIARATAGGALSLRTIRRLDGITESQRIGGRMSGESPREEKIEAWPSNVDAERANHAKATGDTVQPTFERQRSTQQLAAFWPFGQHESWDISECEIAVV